MRHRSTRELPLAWLRTQPLPRTVLTARHGVERAVRDDKLKFIEHTMLNSYS